MKPKFFTCSLKEVLDDISSAEVIPADLQEPYSWSKSDVISFAENIFKGYPMGNVVVWHPKDEDKSGVCVLPSMGPLNFLPSSGHNTYLLDGINRFTSLLWMRHGLCDVWAPSEMEKETWLDGTELMLDPKTEQFAFYDMVEVRKSKKLLIPASVFINDDMAYMREWANNMEAAGHSRADIDLGIAAQEKAANMFRESRMTVTEVRGVSPLEAKDAYLNICRPKSEDAAAKFDVFASIEPEVELTPPAP
ncbi:DUF262 domain-containing protein [Sulfitobacter sp. R18_1]|uniref:DUF262 domain-containing protein n=1 Tax=Sulfitobacter sp. R18_1 TaxID=2821104 RepID=UPI001ADD2228|nr:DUF262 domain-containing protein [Sulfitobacter sp. R18_1]MBO9428015.1 DUF262 domain-containing protein [Sulfitobacter sp. R18_1]